MKGQIWIAEMALLGAAVAFGDMWTIKMYHNGDIITADERGRQDIWRYSAKYK